MRTPDRVLIAAAGLLGPLWLWARREAYSGIAQPLTPAQRQAFAPYFAPALLDAARVATVDRVENPAVFALFEALGRGIPVDLTGVWGMCFGDVVAITHAAAARGHSTLFHELVHTAQMRRLGHRAFCREYLRDYLLYGYTGIALEEEAFDLQHRFDRGEVFQVP